MRIIGRVNSCKDCPNRRYGSGGVYECSKVDAPLVDSNVIPEWCPLPRDPAQIAARAELNLANARAVVATTLDLVGQEQIGVDRVRELLAMAAEQLSRPV